MKRILFLTFLAFLAPAAGAALALTPQEVVHQAKPSIVRIEVVGVVPADPKVKGATDRKLTCTGTGFIVSGDGFVVTNSHVAHPPGVVWKEEPTLRLMFPEDGFKHTVRLVAHDPLSDLAVLKIGWKPQDGDFRGLFEPNGKLKALHWADPAKMEVGEDVLAIGFAREQEGQPTVTKGIVSGVGRQFATRGLDGRPMVFGDLVQTDAAINPGNSGGPLLNLRGEVVGVNTYRFGAIVDQDAAGRLRELDTTEGINFARSARSAQPISERLQAGPIRRVDLGAVLGTVTRERSEGLSLFQGAVIGELAPDAPLEKAGARKYDVITSVQGGANPADVYIDSISHNRKSNEYSAYWMVTCEGDVYNSLAQIPRDKKVTLYVVRPPAAVIAALEKGRPMPGDQKIEGELRTVELSGSPADPKPTFNELDLRLNPFLITK
jgi:S1-C subfamily serine protease